MDVSITATLSYIVFAFGSLLVAIQVSSAQLTPRIIATTLLRDNVIRSIVGVFVYGLLIAVAVKNRMDDGSPIHGQPRGNLGTRLHRGVPVS